METVMLEHPQLFHVEDAHCPQEPSWLVMWGLRILYKTNGEEEAREYLEKQLCVDVITRS